MASQEGCGRVLQLENGKLLGDHRGPREEDIQAGRSLLAEPVTQAAAGSSAFSIEWRGDKVLIKPMKSGVSTDLFVWTQSQRFTYELDPPGDVKNMNFVVDNPAQVPKPIRDTTAEQMNAVADMALSNVFLGCDKIAHSDVRKEKKGVLIRIENVYQSSNSLYIGYTIANGTDKHYRVTMPTVRELKPETSGISFVNLRRVQLDPRAIEKLGRTTPVFLAVASATVRQEDLQPGEETRGVIVLRQQFSAPIVLEVAFANAGDRRVSSAFVF